MMYGWSRYATGSGFPIGGWLTPMMWGNGGGQCAGLQNVVNSPVFIIGSFLYLVTWVLILVALVALIRFLWRKAGH